jgi:hypothetical protein
MEGFGWMCQHYCTKVWMIDALINSMTQNKTQYYADFISKMQLKNGMIMILKIGMILWKVHL